jgi:hypothetical protein
MLSGGLLFCSGACGPRCFGLVSKIMLILEITSVL